MKNNKSMILITSVLMTSFLFACGKSTPVAGLQQPTQLVSLSVDPCPPNCDCRPQNKVQGGSTKTADANDPVVNAPVVTKINTKTTDTKIPAATDTKATDDLLGSTPLPEVSAPPSASPAPTDGSTTAPVKEKTKVGQLIDKIKNIFKKKS